MDQIISECGQYNRLAQKLLYEKYAPLMKGLCLRYVSDPDAVNDVLQEGFIKVFSHIKQYSGSGSFEGWMKRIFINTSISHLRKNRKKKHLNIDEINESDLHGSLIQQEESNIDSYKKHFNLSQNSSEFVLSTEISEKELLHTLNKIPEIYRIVFNLYCIENVKHEEIAEILEIDVVTSRSRLMRARNMIQKELYAVCVEKHGEK